MKVLRFILLVFLTICHASAWANVYTPQTVPDPKATNSSIRFVSNPDGILSPAEVLDIDALCKQLNRDTQAQLAVVVLESIGDQDLFEFSQTLFSLWGIGDKERGDGLLIVYLDGPHKVRIHTGRGIEGDITDAFSSHVINSTMNPVFKEGRAGQGLLSGVSEIYDKVAKKKDFESLRTSISRGEYKVGTIAGVDADTLTVSQAYSSPQSTAKEKDGGMTDDEFNFINYIIVGVLFLFIIAFKYAQRSGVKAIRRIGFLFQILVILLMLIMVCITLWAIVPLLLWILTIDASCPKCGRNLRKVKREIIKAPTYEEKGLQRNTYYCKTCGEVVEEEEIPVLKKDAFRWFRGRRWSRGSGSYGSDGDSWGGGGSDGGGANGSW